MEDDELEELKQMFLEECLENFELLENGLMRMGDGECSSDTLNEVFRAAHSIKGGAAGFGFNPMSELTHHMETLLDEMRSGKRSVEEVDVDLLLEALDILQEILQVCQAEGTGDHENRLALQTKLEQAVSSSEETPESTTAVSSTSEEQTPSVSSTNHWQIKFAPNPNFLQRGNNPLSLLRELARLGTLELTLNNDCIPEWSVFDPNISYLSWNAQLVSSESEETIRAIFDWVEDDCVLEITLETSSPTAPTQVDVIPSIESEKETASKEVTPKKAEEKSDPPAKAKKSSTGAEGASIRIATDKIDQLINMVGELVITQSMLSRVGDQAGPIDVQELRERLADLEHHTRDLQESVMQVRMLPISSAFSRLPRLVRDLSKKLDKNIDLVLTGGTTELDKTVLERMVDPLVHLVRNSLDHGLENTAERAEVGKSSRGQLELSARQESGNVIIEISDDGRGINGQVILKKARERGIVQPDEELNDDQINQLIFAPGFSTAETVSDVSGRGVGMDVVRRNIVDLGGQVNVHSQLGTGTTVKIKLPLSLAILDGQLVRIADQIFVIPILSIIESMEVGQTDLSVLPGGDEVCLFRGSYLPTINVARQFQLSNSSDPRMVVIVETHLQRIGLLVDDILGQQQVVIKPLEKNYKAVNGLAGATIMSDGAVALILDPNGFGQINSVTEAA